MIARSPNTSGRRDYGAEENTAYDADLETKNLNQQKRLTHLLMIALLSCILGIGLFGGCAQLLMKETVIALETSKEATSADIPLELTVEKSRWDGKDMLIWGTIKNMGNKTYKYVKVICTVKDSSGGFIGRKTWLATPHTIGPGQVGYIEGSFIECEGRKPDCLEYKVIGELEKR